MGGEDIETVDNSFPPPFSSLLPPNKKKEIRVTLNATVG